MKKINRTGLRYGRLLVLRELAPAGKNSMWECQCDCGATVEATGPNLHTGNTRSCGCLKHDVCRSINVTHGASRDPVYTAWTRMRQRCYNQNDPSYRYYGARGIRVCRRWRKSFEAFRGDMGPRQHGLTLEREDSNGHYTPSNCRWASRLEQARNKRTTWKIKFRGKLLAASEWAARLSVPYSRVIQRLRKGWTAHAALLTHV